MQMYLFRGGVMAVSATILRIIILKPHWLLPVRLAAMELMAVGYVVAGLVIQDWVFVLTKTEV